MSTGVVTEADVASSERSLQEAVQRHQDAKTEKDRLTGEVHKPPCFPNPLPAAHLLLS